MPPLAGIPLVIPSLWERQDDWQEAVEEAEPEERSIVVLQAHLAVLLEALKGAESDPENLAWLSLWSRVFNCCEGARGAQLRESSFTMLVMLRVLFDVSLHVEVIARQLIRANAESTSLARSDVADRLSAYTAWSLCNDLVRYQN